MGGTIKDIISRIKTGDKEAFSELYILYFPKLYSFLLQIIKDETIAEDITQEVFFRLWVNHNNIDPNMSYDSYFFNIAKNIAINIYRRDKVEKKYKERNNFDVSETENPEKQTLFSELQQIINEAIDSMPPQQQYVFRLSREDGLLNEQIANMLGISKRTVEKHISNSLKKLRSIIKKNYLLFFIIS